MAEGARILFEYSETQARLELKNDEMREANILDKFRLRLVGIAAAWETRNTLQRLKNEATNLRLAKEWVQRELWIQLKREEADRLILQKTLEFCCEEDEQTPEQMAARVAIFLDDVRGTRMAYRAQYLQLLGEMKEEFWRGKKEIKCRALQRQASEAFRDFDSIGPVRKRQCLHPKFPTPTLKADPWSLTPGYLKWMEMVGKSRRRTIFPCPS